jgi:hypothetical protein
MFNGSIYIVAIIENSEAFKIADNWLLFEVVVLDFAFRA